MGGNRAEGRAAVAGVPARPEEAEVMGKIVGQESRRSFYSKNLCLFSRPNVAQLGVA